MTTLAPLPTRPEEPLSSGALPPTVSFPELITPNSSGSENEPEDTPAPEFFPAPDFNTIPDPPSASPHAAPDYTDADLFAAFLPLFPQIRETISPDPPAEMEPLLRTTIRRALAERSAASSHYLRPNALHRLFWHLQALFTGRTYEDVLFEKTRRFRIEEAYLFDNKTFSLLSFASCDPARHGEPRRVEATAHRLAAQLKNERENLRTSFVFHDGRGVLARAGRISVLATLVRGTVPEVSLADLAFIHQGIENRFSYAISSPEAAVLLPLQSYLEDCLLIQAPAPAL